jgi:hypothetical protein
MKPRGLLWRLSLTMRDRDNQIDGELKIAAKFGCSDSNFLRKLEFATFPLEAR